MLSYDNIRFDYDPFPIGLAAPAFKPDDYAEMVAGFPDLAAFKAKASKGSKYSLSRHNNAAAYRRHLRKFPIWRRFYDYIHDDAFLRATLVMLKAHNIDLGLEGLGIAQHLVLRAKALHKSSPQPHFPRLKARFEFSAMPVTGGSIRPHTDHPQKIITLVIPILAPGEWNPAVGGGTSVVWPKDRTLSFNHVNDYLDFDQVDEVRTYPFAPNQCLIFVKTYNSWHAVWPMTGNDPDALRRTLTINIESS